MPNNRKNILHLINTYHGVLFIKGYEYQKGRCMLDILCTSCGNRAFQSPNILFDKRRKIPESCKKCCPKNLQDYSKRSMTKKEAQISVMYSNYKSKAKLKKWDFNLTKDDFDRLIFSNCHYCGLEPNRIRIDRAKIRRGISESCYSNGIDRINSQFGYIEGNVLTCCEDCNKAKRNLSYDVFMDLINRIYNHSAKKHLDSLNIAV